MPRSIPKKSATSVILVFLVLWLWQDYRSGLPADLPIGDGRIAELFAEQQSGVMVEFEAKVERKLADDREGSAHQRFILALKNGHSVLVAHNIDLAERVPLQVGDRVRVRGEYEYNPRGGVVHWTHRNPDRGEKHGWVELAGIRYE